MRLAKKTECILRNKSDTLRKERLVMLFEVKDLYKSFGEKKVLEGIGFSAQSGRALGLLGRNGAGKTTTIRIITGVFPADSGQVLLDGAPMNHQDISIGYLPEEHGLYPKKTITEQIVYLAQLRGMRVKDARASLARWLAKLDVQEYANKKLDTLSKGNQQKIQLVAALVTNPDFLILDEPFSGLDPVNAALLKAVVKDQIQKGKLVLFSSHQMNYVEEFCDSIAILHEGKIVLSGQIDEIKRSYDRSIIEVASGQRDAIEAFCADKLAALVAKTERGADKLYIHLKKPEQKAALLEALSGQGFDIDLFAVYEPSLNDIFVEYTGTSAAEEEEVSA